ncbi:ATP-binding cassette domain-containing protein [Streptomyces sp. col6]|uniref:ABC transporter ATP-binding protein n=1 Tax=Streptomyces sp. col6 TaxID=2478958 RepID=UPI0011CDD750|nr:ATP-binding cassette domain-containing protein [Streptomyces sp. col6]TXS00571.1 ATP-binding cassette domain-containing protein [Streptomyces sp. col6]
MTSTATRIGTGTAVRAQDLHRTYGHGGSAVRALRGVSVDLSPGTFTAVMGPAASGRTTLLHCLAGRDRPSRGSVRWGGTEVTRLPERRLAELRRERAGFVSRAFNLVPSLTVEENVGLLAGRDRAREVLARVGLAGYERHRPGQLSGDRQQRVAIARALVARPDVLFADDPAGALGPAAGLEIAALLRAGADREGQTCVLVTDDPVAAAYADRVLLLAEGRLVDELCRPDTARVRERLGR